MRRRIRRAAPVLLLVAALVGTGGCTVMLAGAAGAGAGYGAARAGSNSDADENADARANEDGASDTREAQ